MHPFYEIVLVLKNLCKGFNVRPKLQHKRHYQSTVMFFQLKRPWSLYPGFTQKIPGLMSFPHEVAWQHNNYGAGMDEHGLCP